jgi:hypothetical protein
MYLCGDLGAAEAVLLEPRLLQTIDVLSLEEAEQKR